MSDINPSIYKADSSKYTNYGFTQPIGLYDYANYATIKEFESTLQNTIPVVSSYKSETLELYGSKGKVDPEKESPTQLIDEGLKHVLNFSDKLIKQLGLLTEQQLNKQAQANSELINLITLAVNTIFGVATGAFSFNAFSIIGSVLSVAGFSNIGGLISSLGGAKDNMKKAQEQEEKVTKEIGKQVALGLKATQDIVESAEGIQVNLASLFNQSAQVIQQETNVSHTVRTPNYNVAAETITEASTNKVTSSNYHTVTHSYLTTTVDSATNFKTKHSTRYHSASLVEIAAQADYIASSLFSYADFRWQQTGQSVGSLPITNPIGSVVESLFEQGTVPVTGVNIDLSSLAKLTSAMFNINYGAIYAIDGFTFINCGIGVGLASIPPRQVMSIQDINPSPTVSKNDPSTLTSVNNKTPETLYSNNENLKGINLGQLFTKVKETVNELENQYGVSIDTVDYLNTIN